MIKVQNENYETDKRLLKTKIQTLEKENVTLEK